MPIRKLTETEKLIANALLAKRKASNLTQTKLSKLINSKSSSWIGAVERGQKPISIAKLDALLKGLNTNLTELLIEHYSLSNKGKEVLNKYQLESWRLIKELDKGQTKILNEVLKIIDKHKRKIEFLSSEDIENIPNVTRKLKLASRHNKK